MPLNWILFPYSVFTGSTDCGYGVATGFEAMEGATHLPLQEGSIENNVIAVPSETVRDTVLENDAVSMFPGVEAAEALAVGTAAFQQQQQQPTAEDLKEEAEAAVAKGQHGQHESTRETFSFGSRNRLQVQFHLELLRQQQDQPLDSDDEENTISSIYEV